MQRPGRLVLLGHPVNRSLSPTFQNAALAVAGIDVRYEAVDVEGADLERVLNELRAENTWGNVTVPHKEQMRALQTLHEGFGRNFGAALSALLRSIVEVKLTSVDQLTYSEFVFSLENPTCFNLLRAAPLEGNLILDINPSILYPIIDRLLGGGRESAPRGQASSCLQDRTHGAWPTCGAVAHRCHAG